MRTATLSSDLLQASLIIVMSEQSSRAFLLHCHDIGQMGVIDPLCLCCVHTQWENAGAGGTAAERRAGAPETDGNARWVLEALGRNNSRNVVNETCVCV